MLYAERILCLCAALHRRLHVCGVISLSFLVTTMMVDKFIEFTNLCCTKAVRGLRRAYFLYVHGCMLTRQVFRAGLQIKT